MHNPKPTRNPSVKWTRHAIERVAERFGFRDDIIIPSDKIIRCATRLEPKTRFRIQACGVVFVCVAIPCGAMVVTVLHTRRKFKKDRKKQLRAWSKR